MLCAYIAKALETLLLDDIYKHWTGRRGNRVGWSLSIQRCGHGFESQWQWVRSAVITEAVEKNQQNSSRAQIRNW